MAPHLWVWGGLLYVALHLALYVLILRRLQQWREERTIFRYHVLSAVLVTSVVAVASLLGRQAGAVAAGTLIVGLHGLYSLSFLELWSLAEGGYSLSILRQCATRGPLEEGSGLVDLRQLGESKKEARLASLQGLGLVRRTGDLLTLTKTGSIAALGLRALRWLSDQGPASGDKCG